MKLGAGRRGNGFEKRGKKYFDDCTSKADKKVPYGDSFILCVVIRHTVGCGGKNLIFA
jgi:hypothetical protein